KGPRCYNCGEYGHISCECKASRKPKTLKVEGEKKKEENSAHIEDENNDSEDSKNFTHILDSGCTKHMTPDISIFESPPTPCAPKQFRTAN
ncbi:hypothetical protein BT96DRAFT_739441, partial [Gymnopus androsaceus JB14]